MEDFAIVELYWDRDEQAIEQSDKKYGRYCTSVAYHVLHNREDSAECVNDTWLAAWNSMPVHRPEKLGPYLGKITRNLALNLYEKNTAEKRGGTEVPLVLDELAEVIGQRSDVEEAVELSNLSDALSRFLSRQSADQRKIFVQRYWYCLSVKEIAQQCRQSESKVKMSLMRMREKLRDFLREEGYAV